MIVLLIAICTSIGPSDSTFNNFLNVLQDHPRCLTQREEGRDYQNFRVEGMVPNIKWVFVTVATEPVQKGEAKIKVTSPLILYCNEVLEDGEMREECFRDIDMDGKVDSYGFNEDDLWPVPKENISIQKRFDKEIKWITEWIKIYER